MKNSWKLCREEEGRVFWQCVRQYTGTVFSNPSMVVFDGHTMCFCLDKIKFPDDQYLMVRLYNTLGTVIQDE